jgi:hypothetical protein
VGVPLLLQFSIALFTGMVAATFVPPVRRSVPRLAEVVLWVALITACVLGVMSVTDKNARDLSMAAVWAAEQVVNTIFGLLLGGVGAWIHEHRFAIASWLIIVAGADVLALMLIRSMRSATPWTPRVRLGEWMELPPAGPALPARQPAADPLAAVNRRLAAATAVLATAALAQMAVFSVWLRGAMQTQAVRMRPDRLNARSRLESLRDATAHLHFAARAWYEGAGQPAMSTVAEKASDAATWTARTAGRGLKPAAERAGQVIDIRALLGAQSLGWYGPMGLVPVDASGERESLRGEISESDPQRPDSLAS